MSSVVSFSLPKQFEDQYGPFKGVGHTITNKELCCAVQPAGRAHSARNLWACVSSLCERGVRVYVNSGASTRVRVCQYTRRDAFSAGMSACIQAAADQADLPCAIPQCIRDVDSDETTTPLHLLVAASVDCPQSEQPVVDRLVRLLVSGGLPVDEPAVPDAKQSAPASLAIYFDNVRVLGCLLRAGADCGMAKAILYTDCRIDTGIEIEHRDAMLDLIEHHKRARALWRALNDVRDSLDNELELYDGQVLFDDVDAQTLLVCLAFQPDEVVEHVVQDWVDCARALSVIYLS